MKPTILALLVSACVLAGCSTTKPNAVDRLFFNVTTNSTGQIQLAEKPETTAIVEATKATGVPYAGLIGMGLTGLLAAYRETRNRNVARALITGIEASRDIIKQLPDGTVDKRIVETLEAHAKAAGVADAIDALVQKNT